MAKEENQFERELPSETPKLLSIFQGGVIGWAAALFLVGAFTWAQAAGGFYDNAVAFEYMVFGGGVGGLLGCTITARVRKYRIQGLPADEMPNFMGTWRFYLLVLIVLLGALACSSVSALVHDALIAS